MCVRMPGDKHLLGDHPATWLPMSWLYCWTTSRADPAAEQFDYPVAFDVRELVTLDDVMDEMDLGPNGCAGAVYIGKRSGASYFPHGA